MTLIKASTFTAAQEAMIIAASPLNLESATLLAAHPEMSKADGSPRSYRSVVAKARTLEGVTYARKAVTTKTGEPVEKKLNIVAEIAKIVEANLDGLEVAPKGALQAIRDFVTARAA